VDWAALFFASYGQFLATARASILFSHSITDSSVRLKKKLLPPSLDDGLDVEWRSSADPSKALSQLLEQGVSVILNLIHTSLHLLLLLNSSSLIVDNGLQRLS